VSEFTSNKYGLYPIKKQLIHKFLVSIVKLYNADTLNCQIKIKKLKFKNADNVLLHTLSIY